MPDSTLLSDKIWVHSIGYVLEDIVTDVKPVFIFP